MNKKDPMDVLREEIMAHPNLEQFFTDKVGMNLRQYMTSYVIDNTSVEELVNELDLQHSRCCSECGKPMYEGFCIEDGADYYCSEECLYKHLSEEEYNQLYDEERGNSYWTSWID
jgi:hypothetical protein